MIRRGRVPVDGRGRRGRGRVPVDEECRLVYAIASALLCYPERVAAGRFADALAAVGALQRDELRAPLSRAADWLATSGPGSGSASGSGEVERHHVATFDLTRRASPYLTYYRYGDTRARGMALLALKHTYRRAGYTPADDELPDYLPVVLEFAALTGEAGVGVLQTHRAGLELLRAALADAGSPYAQVLDAVVATLPQLSARQAQDVRRLAIDGPPRESVGLDPVGAAPFAPPELLGYEGWAR